MDRRRRRFSPSLSRSPARHRTPNRDSRHRSRSQSPSTIRHQSHASPNGPKEWKTREQLAHSHCQDRRSGSYERPQDRKRHSSNIRQSKRRRKSTSRSGERYVTSQNHRDAISSPIRRHNRQQSLSPIRRRSPDHHVRRHYSRSRSSTPRQRSPKSGYGRRSSPRGDHGRRSSPRGDHGRRSSPRGDHGRRSSPRRHSPSLRRHRSVTSLRDRSGSSQCPSPSPQRRRSPSPRRERLRQRSPSSRCYSQHQCSSSPRRRSHDRRSQSHSRRRRSYHARSSSSYGRSSSRNMDRRYTDTPAKQSPIEFPTSSFGTSPKTKAAGTTDDKQDLKESNKGDRVSDEHCLSTTGNHDHRVDNIHDVAYGSNHHQVHNRRPLQQDACASSSSMTIQGSSAPVQSIATSDRVTTSFPHGGQTSALTPTKSTGANGNLHTNSPVVNPVVNPMMEKKRQAQRESHRAYLKSNSDYNRAEIKYVSIEAELRLAEFWLEIMTKNLEDVGKRIEVHDWNFQKITGQDESNVA